MLLGRAQGLRAVLLGLWAGMALWLVAHPSALSPLAVVIWFVANTNQNSKPGGHLLVGMRLVLPFRACRGIPNFHSQDFSLLASDRQSCQCTHATEWDVFWGTLCPMSANSAFS